MSTPMHLDPRYAHMIERPAHAPAADHAHLCSHPPDELGPLTGCPAWPACVTLDTPGTVPHAH